MAAITVLGSTYDTNSGTHSVTATPSIGDLIVIVAGVSGNSSLGTTIPTDDNSSGTYGSFAIQTASTSGNQIAVYTRSSLISSAVSTVFTHAQGTTTGGGLTVFAISGISRTGSSASKQTAIQNNQSSGGTPGPTFTNSVTGNNPVIGVLLNGSNPATVTPRSSPSYTEASDSGWNTPTTGVETMYINSGETGTTISWGSTSGTAFASLVMEIDSSIATSKSDSTAVSDSITIQSPLVTISVSETSTVADSPTASVLVPFAININEVTAVSDSDTATIPNLPSSLQIVLDGITSQNGFVPGIRIV